MLCFRIRPIDTYGSVFHNGESEIMVPRPIAPNKNRDSHDDQADTKFLSYKDLFLKLKRASGRQDIDKLIDCVTTYAIIKRGRRLDTGNPYRDRKGRFTDKCHNSYGIALSPEGTNKPCIGFRDKKADRLHRKHWTEFGYKSQEEYNKGAIEFIMQPVGGDIDGYLREEDKAIVWFNTKTGQFGVGYPGAEILTYHILKYNKKTGLSNLNLANDYFNVRKKEERLATDSNGPA